MATPHLTRSRRRSSGDGVRSALCSIAPGSSDPRLPTPSQTCTPQPAPCCVAGTKRELATQPLCSWRRANPGSTAARHAHGALLRGCMLPELASPTARPPSCTAHPVAHNSAHKVRKCLLCPERVLSRRLNVNMLGSLSVLLCVVLKLASGCTCPESAPLCSPSTFSSNKYCYENSKHSYASSENCDGGICSSSNACGTCFAWSSDSNSYFCGSDCGLMSCCESASSSTPTPSSLNCASGCQPGWPGDGDCDTACNVAACNYDNGDCSPPAAASTPTPSSLNCAPGCQPGWPGDGYCNTACNVAACNYDNGDCSSSPSSCGKVRSECKASTCAGKTVVTNTCYISGGITKKTCTCSSSSPSSSIAGIVGAILGVLVGIGGLVAIIITYCCCMKKTVGALGDPREHSYSHISN